MNYITFLEGKCCCTLRKSGLSPSRTTNPRCTTVTDYCQCHECSHKVNATLTKSARTQISLKRILEKFVSKNEVKKSTKLTKYIWKEFDR